MVVQGSLQWSELAAHHLHDLCVQCVVSASCEDENREHALTCQP